MSETGEPEMEVRGMVGQSKVGIMRWLSCYRFRRRRIGSSLACFHVICIQGTAEGPGFCIHKCITAVEQREAFRVIELAREHYVRQELILAVFLSFDEVMLFARGDAGIQNGSRGDETML